MKIRYKGTGKEINLKTIWNFMIAMYRKYWILSKRERDLVKKYTSSTFTVKETQSVAKEIAELEASNLPDHLRIPLIRTALVRTKSPECITGGKCKHCLCPTPDKFYEAEGCEHGCYEEWPV